MDFHLIQIMNFTLTIHIIINFDKCTIYDKSKDCLFLGGGGSSSILKPYTNIDFERIFNVNNVEIITIRNETIKLNK